MAYRSALFPHSGGRRLLFPFFCLTVFFFHLSFSSSAQTPYGGTPASIPGIMEAENFDNGGEGVAYHDTTVGNTGNVYRTTEDVDLAACTDSGGGYKISPAVAGEWLKYTVNVTSAGIYLLEVRSSAAGAGGTFHLEIDGVDKTGAMTVPNTSSTAVYSTTTKTDINLTAGQHVMRVVMDANGAGSAVGDFNYFRFTQLTVPFLSTPASIPGTIQAENFDNGGEGVAYHDTTAGSVGANLYGVTYHAGTNVDINTCNDTGGGYKVGWTDVGEWLTYTVNVASTGTYTFDARVASNGAGGTFHMEVDGVNKTGTMTAPTTGGWENYQTISKTGISLTVGQHIVKVVMDANGPNGWVGDFNYFRFSTASYTPLSVSITNPANNSTAVASSSLVISADATDTDGQITKVEFFQGGTKIGEKISAPYNFTLTNMAVGAYSFTAKATDEFGRTVTSSAVSISVQAPATNFVYDDAGRLIAAINTGGETVVYTYDAVGNHLSTARRLSSVVSIISFSPGSGAIGDTVTIYGTGFSATAAQNTVKFNGTTAQIISATTNKLVAIVPSGATTGTISVTAPGGTATSTTPFTIGPGVRITPVVNNLLINSSLQLAAIVSSIVGDQSVTWSVNGVTGGNATVGTISTSGLYTAPSQPIAATIRATSVTLPTIYGELPIAVLDASKATGSVSAPLFVRYGNPLNFGQPTSPTVSVRVGTLGGAAPPSPSVSVRYGTFSGAPVISSAVMVTNGPVVQSISPLTIPRNATTTITITGANLTGVTSLLFIDASTNNIETNASASNINVNAGGTQLTANINVTTSAAIGIRVLYLSTPTSGSPTVNTGTNTITFSP